MHIRTRFLVSLASALFVMTASAEVVTTTAPALVDSTADTSTEFNDYTQHTYAVRAGGQGTFANALISRKFAQPIGTLRAFIVAGQADDIGYVGNTLVTDQAPQCARVSSVLSEVEVTDQVTIAGDTASFTLRAQENCCCWTGWGEATEAGRANARIRWEVSLGGLEIRAAHDEDASAGELTAAKETGTKTARFPLGRPFAIQLVKKNASGTATPVSATYELTTQTVTPALPGRALFAAHVALPFGTGATTTKRFQSVHLGTANLRITPVDTTIKPVNLPIVIARPAGLGTTFTTFDPAVTDLGHARGIPPQFIKGQMDHESDFVGTGYRYEPLSSDLDRMSQYGANLRETAPYSDYRIATADNLAAGALLTAEDVAPRQRYFITRGGTRRQITAADTLVSAQEIVDGNDRAARWREYSSNRRLQRIDREPHILGFTAQTPVAASYGIFQVMYETAIGAGWRGAFGNQRNPKYLFDSTANNNNGGGSAQPAMVIFMDGFNRANRNASTNPRYTSRADLETDFQRGYNNYNHNFPGEDAHHYGSGVISDSRRYEPRPSTPIFQ